jgi:serine/threonine protein kinase
LARGTIVHLRRGDIIMNSPLSSVAVSALPPRFVPQGFLGQGVFGCVIEAYDRAVDEMVALKISLDESVNATLKHECKLARKFKHPNVVGVREYGEYRVAGQVRAYAIMDLVRYGHGTGHVPDPHKYIAGILLGLACLHAQHIRHGDIKAPHLLTTPDGAAHIIDLGFATTNRLSAIQRNQSYQKDLASALDVMEGRLYVTGEIHGSRLLKDAEALPTVAAWRAGRPPRLEKLAAELEALERP